MFTYPIIHDTCARVMSKPSKHWLMRLLTMCMILAYRLPYRPILLSLHSIKACSSNMTFSSDCEFLGKDHPTYSVKQKIV